MATHSSILASRVPWTVACQAPLSGSQELDTTQLENHHHRGIQKDGTDEPTCRAAVETQTEKRLTDTVGEGEGGTI